MSVSQAPDVPTATDQQELEDKEKRREQKFQRSSQKRLDALDKRVAALTSAQRNVQREMGKLVVQLARLAPSLDPSVDERFLDIAQPLVESQRTMLDYDRLLTLWQAVGNVTSLPYSSVEIGTFRGGSAAFIAQAFLTLTGAHRELHVVDTFEGHLDETFTDFDDVSRQQGKFQDTTVEDVREFLTSVSPEIQVYQGDAAAVMATWPERQYSLVHLDVDLYQPMIDCLNYFGSRLPSGAVIIVDDYETPTCPGVVQAVTEFLAGTPAFQKWRLQAEQLILIRR